MNDIETCLYFFKEKGDMERCGSYDEATKKYPEIRRWWHRYKYNQELNKTLLEASLESLLDKDGREDE